MRIRKEQTWSMVQIPLALTPFIPTFPTLLFSPRAIIHSLAQSIESLFDSTYLLFYLLIIIGYIHSAIYSLWWLFSKVSKIRLVVCLLTFSFSVRRCRHSKLPFRIWMSFTTIRGKNPSRIYRQFERLSIWATNPSKRYCRCRQKNGRGWKNIFWKNSIEKTTSSTFCRRRASAPA